MSRSADLEATADAHPAGTHGRRPLLEFIATQSGSAVVLLAATLAALIWANSPWGASYERLWETPLGVRFGDADLVMSLRHWINDGLMALFFFVAGLEIRREFDMGELRERRRVATPVVAAIGGVAVPALLYWLVNRGHPAAHAWGIAMGTDTAFAIGVLTLVGGHWAGLTRTFLLTLVIIDDVVALSVIAAVYSEGIDLLALGVALAFFGVNLWMRRIGVRNGVAYFVVGFIVWLATVASGVHATVAGVAIGLTASAYPPTRAELERAGARWRLFRQQPTAEMAASASRTLALTISPNERLQYMYHPITSYVVVPVFALANAGVALSASSLGAALDSPVTWGVVLGLVVGKPLGITLATWLFSRRWLGGIPLTVPWPPLIGAATLAGIGFTVALLVATIALSGEELEAAKIGILGASLVASLLAWIVFHAIDRLPSRFASTSRLVAPLLDLVEPVDPAVDHVRGPLDGPGVVTLVEYGDFQCPDCGRAEPVLRQLQQQYGRELRFVFRHLPLVDIHEHAAMAAEASEAAAEQGKFWEMHDRLFDAHGALGYDDLVGYARELGLDVERFEAELQSRAHARRVARDTASADEMRVAGTPTFFVNGRRHYGGYDLQALAAVVQDARSR
ncbi:MAG TPA: Na+/H+ antiporter NhaA [Longimicrobiales bacterium]